MKLFESKMTIGEWIANAWEVNGKVVGPCFFPIEGTALNKDTGGVALFDEHLVLAGLITGRLFVVAERLVGAVS